MAVWCVFAKVYYMTPLEELFAPQNWPVNSAGPRYIQLKQRIARAIENQNLPPGTPFPPERVLAEISGLSRVTIRKALAPLVEAGLIDRRQGSGSVVAEPVSRVEQSLSHLSSFTEDMARRGMAVTSKWLSRGVFLPAPEEVMALGLTASASVSRLERLRFADGKPMAIERAALPNEILDNPLAVDNSLYDYLATLGKKPVRAVQHIIATNLQKTDAALLSVNAGAAALQISRISYLKSGQIVEFTRAIYRGDAYDFVADLHIPDFKP